MQKKLLKVVVHNKLMQGDEIVFVVPDLKCSAHLDL